MSSTGQYQTAVGSFKKIYTSNDYGVTWITAPASLATVFWKGIAISSTGQYQTAVTANGLIYTSNDYGVTWVAGTLNKQWKGIAISSTGQYQTAVTAGAGSWVIYTSDDYGANQTIRIPIGIWNGVAMSSNGQYQTAVGNNMKIYVSRPPITYTLTAQAVQTSLSTGFIGESGAGGGFVPQIRCPALGGLDCDGVYADGSAVTLNASPVAGHDVFKNWTGDAASCGANQQCVINMGANKNVTATFDRLKYTLDVTVNGLGNVLYHASNGTVDYNCTNTLSTPKTCSTKSYLFSPPPNTTSVTLTATPATAGQVVTWTGDATSCGTNQQCVITMSGAKNITASFGNLTPTLAFTPPLILGGTTWFPGATITPTLTWTSNLPTTQNLLLRGEDATTGALWSTGTLIIPNTGSYKIASIPNTPGQHKFKLSTQASPLAPTPIIIYSGVFTILPSPPIVPPPVIPFVLNITAPTTGVTWVGGTSQQITWNTDLPLTEKFKLERLNANDDSVVASVTNIPNNVFASGCSLVRAPICTPTEIINHSYTINPVPNQPGQYKYRLTSQKFASSSDAVAMSGVFTILPTGSGGPSPFPIDTHLTSPRGMPNLSPGAPITISWTNPPNTIEDTYTDAYLYKVGTINSIPNTHITLGQNDSLTGTKVTNLPPPSINFTFGSSYYYKVITYVDVDGASIQIYGYTETFNVVPSGTILPSVGTDRLTGWAWSSNIGWIAFGDGDGGSMTWDDDDATTGNGYSVKINDTVGSNLNDLNGFAWSSSLGWIRFDPAGPYPPGIDNNGARLVVDSSTGATNVKGWARACSVFVSGCESISNLRPSSDRGAWDGWIKMSGSWDPGVQVVTDTDDTTGVSSRRLDGFAWGSNNFGWINVCPAPGTTSCVSLTGSVVVPPTDKTLTLTVNDDLIVTPSVDDVDGNRNDCISINDLPNQCTYVYSVGTEVTLTPNNTNGITWASGSTPPDPADITGPSTTCPSGNDCILVMDVDRNVTVSANVAVTKYKLQMTVLPLRIPSIGSISVDNPGTVASCAISNPNLICIDYDENTVVNLTASPSTGSNFIFDKWTNACSGNDPALCQITMTSNKFANAMFIGIITPTYQLSVTVTGATGSEKVTGQGIDCDSNPTTNPNGCTETYNTSGVTLTASPNGTRKVSWTGCTVDSNDANKCTIATLNPTPGTNTVTATFADAASDPVNFDVTPTTMNLLTIPYSTSVNIKNNSASDQEFCINSFNSFPGQTTIESIINNQTHDPVCEFFPLGLPTNKTTFYCRESYNNTKKVLIHSGESSNFRTYFDGYKAVEIKASNPYKIIIGVCSERISYPNNIKTIDFNFTYCSVNC